MIAMPELTDRAPSRTIVNMPKVNGERWRHRRAQLGITSDQAASLLDIAGGALRSIELAIKPASLALAYRAARLYSCDVFELLAADDDPLSEPPSKGQEPETNTGPGRSGGNKGRGGKDPKGPKRLKDAAA